MFDLVFSKGKARKMIKQKDSAEVLETAYSDVMNVAQRKQVLFEIYAPELADIPDSEPVPLKVWEKNKTKQKTSRPRVFCFNSVF